MNNIIKVAPTGRINRRDKVDEIDDDQVLSRENIMVIGSKNKYLRKLPGSDRLNSAVVGSGTQGINHAFRYYTKANFRNTFFFNAGVLYYIDDLGNTTAIVSTFDPVANPVTESMRVSAGDVMYFADGTNGMYSFDGNAGHQFIKENNVGLNPVFMLSWLDRMWVFEEDSDDLHFSKNQLPTNFTDATDAGIITIAPKRGSKLMSLFILNETLYILKQDSLYMVQGRTPSEFSIHEVLPALGTPARFSVQNVETGVIFLGSDYEFYSFQGFAGSLKMLTFDIAMAGDLTKNLNPMMNKDRMTQIRSTYHQKIYRCAFNSYQSQNIFNDVEYCFNTTNETDFFTRGNNVGCYVRYDHQPDQQELLTGRSDAGYLMNQYRGQNWDNQSETPTMPILLQTKFIGSGKPMNVRLRRLWMNFSVLTAQQLALYIYQDGRLANSDSTSDSFVTIGEEKTLGFNNIKLISQAIITSRQIPKHDFSKGQNFSFVINENINNRDLAFSSIDLEVIAKGPKRSEKVRV